MSEWTFDGEVWSRPVGDGSVTVDIYPDELVGFSPLVEVRAERDRLRAERDRLLAIVARMYLMAGKGGETWLPNAVDPAVWDLVEPYEEWPDTVRSEPMDPADAELIRRALDHVGGDR